jgi:hypothetical protein
MLLRKIDHFNKVKWHSLFFRYQIRKNIKLPKSVLIYII